MPFGFSRMPNPPFPFPHYSPATVEALVELCSACAVQTEGRAVLPDSALQPKEVFVCLFVLPSRGKGSGRCRLSQWERFGLDIKGLNGTRCVFC